MRAGEEGSVVIEALVAALIVAALAAALFTTLRTDAAAARGVADRRRAWAIARAVLAADAADPASGTRAGVADGLAWRLAVAPLPAPDGPSSLGPVERVVVTVRDPGAGAGPLAILPGLRFGR